MDYVFTSLAFGVPVLLVVLGLRPVTDRELTTFSVRYFLTDDLMSPTLARAIVRSRGLRLLGAAIGFSLPSLLRAVTHDSLNTGSALWWGLTGYLGGVLLAVLLPTAPAGELHAAALVPRRAGDYLPSRTLVGPAVMASLGLLAGLGYAWAPRRPESAGSSGPMGAVVVSVVAALVTLVGARWVVRRRQPVPDPDALAVDDALRSHALHLVFGTGIAVGALAASAVTFQLAGATSVQTLRWTSVVVSLVEIGFAAFAWGGLRNDAWRVRPKVPR